MVSYIIKEGETRTFPNIDGKGTPLTAKDSVTVKSGGVLKSYDD